MMNRWCLLFAAFFGFLVVVSSATNDTECEELYQPYDSPQIIPCKKELILQQGINYTLTCRANTPVVFKQQESPEDTENITRNIQRNYTNKSADLIYETKLELINVDRYAIGYYACIHADGSVDINNTLKQLAAEPNNTASISYIYIYVNGTDSLYAPMREIVMGIKDVYVIECKPSTPDVEIKLIGHTKARNLLHYIGFNACDNKILNIQDIAENTTLNRYSPKIGFILDSEQLDALTDPLTMFTCGFKNQHRQEDKDVLFVKRQRNQPKPIVEGGYNEFLEGETFSLNCSANYIPNSAQVLTWDLPPHINSTAIHTDNRKSVIGGMQYHNITIVNATREHAMIYKCVSINHGGKATSCFEKKLVKPTLKQWTNGLNKKTKSLLVLTKLPVIFRNIDVTSYPPATYSVYKNNIMTKNYSREFLKVTSRTGIKEKLVISMPSKDVQDSGNYTFVASNGYLNDSITFDLRRQSGPVIRSSSVKYCELNKQVTLQCEVTGYPLPDVKWITNSSSPNSAMDSNSTRIDVVTIYKEKAFLDLNCIKNMIINCNASNELNSNTISIDLRVYELPNGFGIETVDGKDGAMWFPEHQDVKVKCVASIFEFDYVTWELNGKEINETVKNTKNQYSLVAKLILTNISSNDAGIYVCKGHRMNGTYEIKEINIQIDKLIPPTVTLSSDISGTVEKFQPIHLFCKAEGVPRPTIKWYKGNKDITETNDTNIEIRYDTVDRMTVNSTIYIKRMKENNHGTFECVATYNENQEKKSIELVLKEVSFTKYGIVIGVIFVLLIAIVVFLVIKLRRDKAKRAKLRRELAAAGLLYFNEGQSRSLNPDLGIDEQADLLPYDERFEFPPEKLILGKQLGAGAFGVVYKADARGIINAEETTPVAVKMVKRTADSMYIRALAMELKIMVHLGKHVNIVNLLGACTKNINKRELLVIVEYCKFGNIHNYMQRHREVFIDQFSDNNKEKSFGKVNRGYDSSGSTGLQSDYGTANTQGTDHTFLTNNSNRTSRKTSESYIQPEWRSNYESDYSYDGRSPRPLTSRDLLCWAFQIARGMEYLASRKILHGDLAARNILLADDNVVKICDFGLARSIYKNDEYQKKENSLLPVKWLAIECMTDRIFSTQSDVWSFGIVLWELFSLAKTPYPNMDPHHLLPYLKEGRRLDKPAYSDDRIYGVMKRCWEEKPTMRPSFSQLQEELGNFLEENVRNHYVDLNNEYMEFNKLPEGQEDYLAMVTAPDYNNMVTPSPHHYVNDVGDPRRFFPPSPTKVDEEGYLQMTPRTGVDIFSPKPAVGTRFDFEPRKLNSRPSEASSVGSELTPMLTINNLPRSGSDSDHEGTAYPYPNDCPTINEEPVDDVFLNKQNNETTVQNAKNVQNTAVTNPTYITFDIDVEKKPKEVINYVNIKPNGLVK